MTTVEYAGFRYQIERTPDDRLRATPLPGQHPAANKDRHRRAAVDEYLADLREG